MGVVLVIVSYVLELLTAASQELATLARLRWFEGVDPERVVGFWMACWSTILAVRTVGAVLLAVRASRPGGGLAVLAWTSVGLQSLCLVARVLVALSVLGTWAHAGGLLWASGEVTLLASLALWARRRRSPVGEVFGWVAAAAVLLLALGTASMTLLGLPSMIWELISSLGLVVTVAIIVQLTLVCAGGPSRIPRGQGLPPVLPA
jgi:hypothetical protein